MNKEDIVMALNTTGLLLNAVEVKGEINLNNQLAAIQQIKRVRDALKEEIADADYDGKRENV